VVDGAVDQRGCDDLVAEYGASVGDRQVVGDARYRACRRRSNS